MTTEQLNDIRELAGFCEEPDLKRRLALTRDAISVWAATKLLDEPNVSLETINQCLKLAPNNPEVYWRMQKYLSYHHQYGMVKRLSAARNYAEDYESLTAELGRVITQHRHSEALDIYKRLFRLTLSADYLKEALELQLSFGRVDTLIDILHLRVLTSTNRDEISETITTCMLQLAQEERYTHYNEVKDNLPSWFSFQEPLKSFFQGVDYFVVENMTTAKQIFESLKEIPHSRLQQINSQMLAKCSERLLEYHEAADAFSRMNKAAGKNCSQRLDYRQSIMAFDEICTKELPRDSGFQPIVLTSFPRSGTTLLENVLDSHPNIRTLEERSAFSYSQQLAFNTPTQKDPDCSDWISRGLAQRNIYVDILLNGVKADASQLIIDKQPALASQIRAFNWIFPDAKYIFPIRHPYDVVLSCFKQNFEMNIAMIELRTIQSAANLYDFVMQRWFDTMESKESQVCYLRYDDVVKNFQVSIGSVLSFLNLAWSDEINDFSLNANSRAARTPSYAKVRKGLSLGVQSSYQNYLFLFDDYCRSKLDPWVEFFGYTVEEPKK